MSAQSPLTGITLVDCAKSNAKLGLTIATKQCGYGTDNVAFQLALQQSCKDLGIAYDGLDSLITEQQVMQMSQGVEIAPDNASDL
ncbi:hypothetical protein IQ266_16655 [filamentous cyanobacterium LEGE 11480]|uniref:Uncharacterized protein n=1 Tax=Romeriopsis navalis LEGE 11480 TaxID=2777977 RepID=A0A928Z3C1_9CYAN|nr:hypothetical protein [Romeriopsis navalis]MBE9031366.1 hypothetical protein [Romeriopsis navalis LEGE 11480]